MNHILPLKSDIILFLSLLFLYSFLSNERATPTSVLSERVVPLSLEVGLLPLQSRPLLLDVPQLAIDGADPWRHIWLVSDLVELGLQVLDDPPGVADSLLVVFSFHLLQSHRLLHVLDLSRGAQRYVCYERDIHSCSR